MCMAHERRCVCGAAAASFHFRDNLFTEQVIDELYCPSCAKGVAVDPSRMISDNGWVISYRMETARSKGKNLYQDVTPEILFDEGYCTWRGLYPGDHIDSLQERQALAALAKTDPAEYVRKLRTWATDRVARLSHEGWRKAQKAA